MLPSDDTTVLDAALAYAAMGLAPIPVYGVRPDGRCMCADAECEARGKHPIGKGWQTRATSDEGKVRDAFRKHVGNIGLAMRGQHIALDFDGEDGAAALAEIAPPATLTAITGSGGRHLVYRIEPWQDKLRDGVKRVDGMDVRVSGHIVVAPSRHRSGGVYRWEGDVPVAPLPDRLYQWLLELQTPKAKVIPVERHRPPTVSDPDLMERRVRAVLAKMDRSVSKQGGHTALFRACCKIVGNGLSSDREYALAMEFNATASPPWDERDVVRKLDEARTKGEHVGLRERVADRNHAVTAPAPTPDIQPTEEWRRLLLREDFQGKERIARTASNVALYILHDPACAGRVRFDTFTYQIVQSDTPWGVTRDRPKDEDVVWVQDWLQREHGLPVKISEVQRGFAAAAARNEFSSAKEWMEGLTWDGQRRLDSWLTTYLGVDDTEYSRLVGRWWLISAVARVMEPGCKADYVLVLEGPQGLKKSQALGVLTGEAWFMDSPVDMGSKEGMQALLGSLVVELAELASLRGRDMETVKAFLTNRVDKYRKPYGANVEPRPRTCVFAGTTNDDEPFHDTTGNRRFWPVRVTKVDADALDRDREQLWAEAIEAFREGAPHYPQTEHEHALCEGEQETRKVLDPWHVPIARWLDDSTADEVTIAEIMEHCLRLDRGQWKQHDQNRVSGVLKWLKWPRVVTKRRDADTGRWISTRVYRRPRSQEILKKTE